MSEENNGIYLSPSPHFTEGITTRMLMCAVILALIPECVYGVIIFGVRALITILVSAAGSVAFEALFQKLTKHPITVNDCSAAVTGIMLALVLPPTVPVWQVLLGDAFAVIVAKGFFGGLGANVWNPALTGRAFLFVSFPVAIGGTWLNPARSEEHTSELQSPDHLVCRLLLEKKKIVGRRHRDVEAGQRSGGSVKVE